MSLFGSIAAAVPGIIKSGSDLLGAALDYHGDKAEREMAGAQFGAQMDESIQRRVADGLKAGINPLAAIGASTNVQPTIHAGGGSDTGSFVSRAGEHLSRLFERKQEDDIAYDNEAKELDLESRRLQNRILKNQVAESTLNLSQGSGNEEPRRIGEEMLLKPSYDLYGRPRLLINQNVLEGDSDNPGYLSAIKHALTTGQVDLFSGKVKSNQLKMMIDDMYYNMYGHHISNLDDLYFAPSEGAFATALLLRGI